MTLDSAPNAARRPFGLLIVAFVFDVAQQTQIGGVNASSNHRVISLWFIGEKTTPMVEGIEGLTAKVNFFVGSDPAKWRTSVPVYLQVIYRDVWPHIDVRFTSRGNDIEQDFVVRPGANLRSIRLMYGGADDIKVTQEGGLSIIAGEKSLKQSRPRGSIPNFV